MTLDTEGRREVATLPEIAGAVGAEYRTLKNWEDRGLFSPSVKKQKGAGRGGCLYNDRDFRLIHMLVRLRERGLDMEALEAVAKELRDDRRWTCPVCHSPQEIREDR